jgi:hypothetical protein
MRPRRNNNRIAKRAASGASSARKVQHAHGTIPLLRRNSSRNESTARESLCTRLWSVIFITTRACSMLRSFARSNMHGSHRYALTAWASRLQVVFLKPRRSTFTILSSHPHASALVAWARNDRLSRGRFGKTWAISATSKNPTDSSSRARPVCARIRARLHAVLALFLSLTHTRTCARAHTHIHTQHARTLAHAGVKACAPQAKGRRSNEFAALQDLKGDD